MKTNNGFNKSLQIMARQLEKATEPLRQQAKRLEEATEPIRRYSRQLEGITEPLRTIAKRLQYIRGLRADKYEHCDHSSRTGCKLIKRTADAYYFSRLKLRPYTMQTREEFQQEAFLAMLQNKDKYQGEEPEAFIRQIIKEHFNELFKAAWRKDRAIDNNKFRGKIKYINPGICSIIAVVFNTWNIDLMLTAYIKNKGTGAKGDYSTFTFLSEQDKAYLQAELLQDMQQAVNQLPDLQRDIIKLYYLQGEKIKDICKLLHISTAREQRTRREALTALKAQLFESSEHEQTAPVNIKPKVYIYRTPESQQTFKQPTLPLTGLFNCSRRSLLITFKRRIYKSISIDNYFNGNEQHKNTTTTLSNTFDKSISYKGITAKRPINRIRKDPPLNERQLTMIKHYKKFITEEDYKPGIYNRISYFSRPYKISIKQDYSRLNNIFYYKGKSDSFKTPYKVIR